MTRRSFFIRLVALGVLLPAARRARAETAEAVAEELRAEGYRNVQIERTLLGRIRITGETDTHRREIVIDRGTGEILRDLTEERQSRLPGREGAAAHA
jgi:ribosomal protein S3